MTIGRADEVRRGDGAGSGRAGETERAVIDRIVDDAHVVLLVGPGEMERIVMRTSLPSGVKEGMWLRVSFDGERLVSAELDEKGTAKAQKRISAKMDLLRRRGSRLSRGDG